MGFKSLQKNIKPGHYMSETQYYKIIESTRSHITVENERGLRFSIAHKIVEEGIFSADQFTEEKTITKTQMAELFASLGDTVFTVNFNKQVKEKDIKDELLSLYANEGGSIKSRAEYNRRVKTALKSVFKGDERTLIGYRIGSDRILGRSMVIDLEQERGDNETWDARQRQVDHRNINWLIYQNVKYTVK